MDFIKDARLYFRILRTIRDSTDLIISKVMWEERDPKFRISVDLLLGSADLVHVRNSRTAQEAAREEPTVRKYCRHGALTIYSRTSGKTKPYLPRSKPYMKGYSLKEKLNPTFQDPSPSCKGIPLQLSFSELYEDQSKGPSTRRVLYNPWRSCS